MPPAPPTINRCLCNLLRLRKWYSKETLICSINTEHLHGTFIPLYTLATCIITCCKQQSPVNRPIGVHRCGLVNCSCSVTFTRDELPSRDEKSVLFGDSVLASQFLQKSGSFENNLTTLQHIRATVACTYVVPSLY